MSQGNLTIFIVIFLLLISAFLAWHFLFSIYEVKFKYDFNPDNLDISKVYKIECIGLNSLGWELNFRDSNFFYSIEKGKEILEIVETHSKNLLRFKLIKEGEVLISLDSKFALNPSKLLLIATE